MLQSRFVLWVALSAFLAAGAWRAIAQDDTEGESLERV